MSEVRIDNFNLDKDSVYDIGDGVVKEMADAFGHELTPKPDVENLGDLIGAVGPAKTLQDNIGKVQKTLGTNANAEELAIDWVERSGLLEKVQRSYIDPERPTPKTIDIALITGGVRNWMQRRANVLAGLAESTRIKGVVLAAGNREMGANEGEDVEAGMTEADYMELVIKKTLIDLGKFPLIELVKVESKNGDEVMAAAAEKMGRFVTAVVASNAGIWVQNAGQLRRAVMANLPTYDLSGRRIYVASDAFPVAKHGEPKEVAQNPLTALGIIARDAQEFVRHQNN